MLFRSEQPESIEQQYANSFENLYDYKPLTQLDNARLALLPILVELPNSNTKICITETDLKSYPGMFVRNSPSGFTLEGDWAPVPKTTELGGHNNLQQLVTSRHDYIASVDSKRSFPWRIFVIADSDEQLLDNDLPYLLASQIGRASCRERVLRLV